MKRIIIIVFIVTSLILSIGCGSEKGQHSEKVQDGSENSKVSTATSTPIPVVPTPASTIAVEVPVGEPPPSSSWIYPAKIHVGNYHPGDVAECYVKVHNGNAHESLYRVKCRWPDRLESGYSLPPYNYEDWVTVSEPTVLLAPYSDMSGSTKSVLISLQVPEEVEVPEKWEFWIGVSDASQGGFVKTEMCIRWMVSAR